MSIEKQLCRAVSFRSKSGDSRSYADACNLVKWLNSRVQSLRKTQEQTAKLIELLRLASEADSPRPYKVGIETLLRPLQDCPWKLVPRVRGTGWYAAPNWPFELHGLILAARLSAHGLDWVRQCNCGKWFVAYNRRNRFCSPVCKRAFESEQRKTEEGKRRRRVYMKEHRADPKVRQRKRRKRQ